jgi:two-component system OmpR family response regulator
MGFMEEPAPHILVVDDHRDIRETLARYLAKHGFRASVADGAASARRQLAASAVDLVVLDVMMPGEDGLALCRHLREAGEVPVILLTAMAEDTDRVVGLEMGADDYVTKPFNPRELVARIRAVLRRVRSLPPQRGAAGEGAAALRAVAPGRGAPGAGGAGRGGGAAEHRRVPAAHRLSSSAPRWCSPATSSSDLTRGRDAGPFDRAVDNQ